MRMCSSKIFECPFYLGNAYRKGGLSITCEGGTSIVLPDQAAFDAFADALCAHPSAWRSCPIARRRNEYYERKEAAERAKKRQR